jgi:phosphoglycerol transferase MdoB-like AlkP superfamily enzyme
MVNKPRYFLPAYLQALLLRLLIVLGLMLFTRIVFYANNSEAFSGLGFGDWIAGSWFDLITICLLFLPFIAFSAAPVPLFRNNRLWRIAQKITFHVPLLFILALNLIDAEYFHFTQKRSTSDLFAIVSAGSDVKQLITTFIKDFWFLIICFVLAVVAAEWLYRKTEPSKFARAEQRSTWKKEVVIFLLMIGFTIFTGRGGITFKPVNIIDASLFTEPQNTALVLNSAFTMVKSYGKDDLEEKTYFSEKTGEKLFNPIHRSQPRHLLPDGTNVMIVMLESFGNEWVGFFNDSVSYTPFLDTLLESSWTFEYGFSNGKKSIEAVPSIAASMPSLMDNPYISASYSNNRLQSLASILKENGYSTAFYHGATNGSMRFNSFAKQLQYDSYLGRREYGNEEHADATWGILDEYFEPWTAKQLTKLRQPFCATMFTLSSHHPYYVPPKWRGRLKKGPYPICQSIAYGDKSLELFFAQAKKEPWYSNTLFVIVADHTPSTMSELYSQRTQMYRIPIAFYYPGGKLPAKKEKAIFQQIDIMPTALDLLNVNAGYYSIGQSYFSKGRREAVTYLEGTYYYFRGNKMLAYSHDKPVALYDYTIKTASPKALNAASAEGKAMTQRLRAIIQRYNRDLVRNQTYAK